MANKVHIEGRLGNYNLVNEDGDILVGGVYLMCDFSSGVSIIKITKDSPCQFMNEEGTIYPQGYYDAGYCAFGYAPVQDEINGIWRYVNPEKPNKVRKNENGEPVVNTFSEAYPYSSNGLALVKTVKGYQYLDTDGGLHGSYKKAEEYIRGYAWVVPNGETSWRIIDSMGKLSKKSFDEEFKSMHSNANQVVEAVMDGLLNKQSDKEGAKNKKSKETSATINEFLNDEVEVYDLDDETIYKNYEKIIAYLKGKGVDRPARYQDALLYAKERKETFRRQLLESERV